ncbi:MAG TPA: hypothetical protein VF534_18300 [Paraburkholderia sp.]
MYSKKKAVKKRIAVGKRTTQGADASRQRDYMVNSEQSAPCCQGEGGFRANQRGNYPTIDERPLSIVDSGTVNSGLADLSGQAGRLHCFHSRITRGMRST